MVFKFLKGLPSWENRFYTVYLFFTTASYGIIFSYFPNITVDMKYILNTTMSLISLYTTFETVGRLIGTLVPFFYKYLNRQVTFATVFALLTISIAVLPVLPTLWLFYICGFVAGFGSSVVSAGYTVWILEIWKNKSGPLIQIAEFGFGIGSILATVILKPFLVGEVGTGSVTGEQTTLTSTLLENIESESISASDRRAKLMLPSLITGACILPIPISSLIMYFIRPYKPPEKVSINRTDENSNLEEIKLFDRPESPHKTFRVLVCLWYTTYVIFETMFLKFAVTYFQYCAQHLSAQDAAQIFWISSTVFTAFRGINVFIGFKVKMLHIIYYHYAILIVGMVLMVIARQSSVTVLWVASIVLCWGFSSMYAGLFAYTAEQLTMTNQLSTIFVLVRGLFTLVTPLIIGMYIEQFSDIFIIVEIFYFCLSLILFAVILYFVRKYSTLLKQK